MMELLAGFTVVMGSRLLDATGPGYSLFWPFLLAGFWGVVIALVVPRGVRPPWNRAVLVAGALIFVLPVAKLATHGLVSFLIALGLLGLACWRGIAASEEPPVYEEVQTRFGYDFGILLLGIILAVARGSIYQTSTWHVVVLIGIVYTVSGMVALVTARIERSREPGALQAVILAVGLQLGLLLFLCLGAVVFFAQDLAGWLFHVTRPFWDVSGHVWFGFVNALMEPLIWIFDQFRGQPTHPHSIGPAGAPIPHGNSRRLKPHPGGTPLWFVIASIVLALLIVAGIGALVWRALPRAPRPEAEPGFKEERRPLRSPGELIDAFLHWLRGLLNRGTELAGGAVEATRRRVLGPLYPEDPVRRFYAQMLHRAHIAGVPRALASTPAEFQTVLAARWPEASDDVAALTHAYVLRRYGEVPFDDQEIRGLRERWHRLRLALRRQKLEPEPVPTGAQVSDDLLGVPEWARRSPVLTWLTKPSALRELLMQTSSLVIGGFALILFTVGLVAGLALLSVLLIVGGSHRATSHAISPSGIALDRSGNVYVADLLHQRIEKLSPRGSVLARFGGPGIKPGRFAQPQSIAVDAAGNVYVADQHNNRVQKLAPNGRVLAVWGGSGSKPGQFNQPRGIALDHLDNIYVADEGNHRIQKLAPNGNVMKVWGTEGASSGQFRFPRGIAVDTHDHVFVADFGNFRIEEFTSGGRYLRAWGRAGVQPGRLAGPTGIAVDDQGNVYETDVDPGSAHRPSISRIQKFAPNGGFLAVYGRPGTAPGQFDGARDAAVDSQGNIYVTDTWNYRVQKLSPDGVPLAEFNLDSR